MKIYKIDYSYREIAPHPRDYTTEIKSYYVVTDSYTMLLKELAELEKHHTVIDTSKHDFTLINLSMISAYNGVRVFQSN